MNQEEFLKQLEIELKISKKSIHTIKKYKALNKELLEISKKQPNEINPQDVKLYLAERFSNKSASAMTQALAAIRYAYKKVFDSDPTLKIERPKKEKKIPSVLTKEEVQSLISATKTNKSRLILSLIYGTGMRVSELVNLKKNDLHFDECIGYIKQAKGRKDRSFNIPKNLIEDIKKFSENSKEFLFEGKKGKLTTRNIQKIVERARKRTGIQKDVHVHTLRHSFATHLLDEGIDIRIIQAILGHENLDTTKIYTHVSTKKLREVKSPFDSL